MAPSPEINGVEAFIFKVYNKEKVEVLFNF